MRIYCINNKPMAGVFNDPKVLSLIKEGVDYDGTLVEAQKLNGDFSMAWLISSISNKIAYHIDRFIQLPDSTVDDMQEETREAIINVETVLV